MSLDAWREVLDVLGRNKLRTFLTGLSVAWGIFMLVLLLAAGTGLRRGVEHDFRDDATNAIWIRRGKTSLPFEGHAPGRPVLFSSGDVEALEKSIDGLEHITGRFYLWGNLPVTHQGESSLFSIRGVHPGHRHLEKTIMTRGRYISERDVERKRKVAVIGEAVVEALYRAGEDPVGSRVQIRGVTYQVVGAFEDEGSPGERRRVYVPLSTAQLVYGGRDVVHQIMYTTAAATVEETQEMTRQTRQLLAKLHDFDPADRRAVQISNRLVGFQKVRQIFEWIRSFVWLVGIGTLFAGVVGVSNIMIISVTERTMEIGVRKALGATPRSILALILREALLVTSLAGYVGLAAAVGVIELVRTHLPANDYVRNPTVDVRVGVIAMLLLVGAGALAGLIPALRAARVKPVVAMQGA